YAGWQVQGDVFGTGPILRREIPEYQGDVGGPTDRVVNSHATGPGGNIGGKDGATGRLLSNPFTITRRFINIWIGGGAHAKKTCVNLLIDGQIVRSATGQNDNKMAERSMGVHEFEGKEATIEIVDDETGSWGNI